MMRGPKISFSASVNLLGEIHPLTTGTFMGNPLILNTVVSPDFVSSI